MQTLAYIRCTIHVCLQLRQWSYLSENEWRKKLIFFLCLKSFLLFFVFVCLPVPRRVSGQWRRSCCSHFSQQLSWWLSWGTCWWWWLCAGTGSSGESREATSWENLGGVWGSPWRTGVWIYNFHRIYSYEGKKIHGNDVWKMEQGEKITYNLIVLT